MLLCIRPQQPEDEAICLRQPCRDDDNTCAACEDMQASALKKLLKTQQVEGRSDGVAGWSKLLAECSSVLRPVLCQEDLPGSADGAEYQMPKERAIFLRQPCRDGGNTCAACAKYLVWSPLDPTVTEQLTCSKVIWRVV